MAANDQKPQGQAKPQDEKPQANPLEVFNNDHLQALTAAGFDSLEKLDTATDDELGAIPGLGAATVKKFRDGQKERGVTPPSNDPAQPHTVVDSGIPISDAVSIPTVGQGPSLLLDADRDTAPKECPECGSKLIPYMGDNPHKEGTAECVRCHSRHGVPTAARV